MVPLVRRSDELWGWLESIAWAVPWFKVAALQGPRPMHMAGQRLLDVLIQGRLLLWVPRLRASHLFSSGPRPSRLWQDAAGQGHCQRVPGQLHLRQGALLTTFFHWNAFFTLPSQMPRPTSSPSRCDQRVAGLPCNPARSTSRAGVAVEGGLAPSCALCWNRPLACCIDVLTASLCSPTRPATLLQGPELLTMWFGESEANVREIFDKASWLIHGYQGMGWATGVQWRLCELEANA